VLEQVFTQSLLSGLYSTSACKDTCLHSLSSIQLGKQCIESHLHQNSIHLGNHKGSPYWDSTFQTGIEHKRLILQQNSSLLRMLSLKFRYYTRIRLGTGFILLNLLQSMCLLNKLTRSRLVLFKICLQLMWRKRSTQFLFDKCQGLTLLDLE